MQFFDLVSIQDASIEPLGERLGYKRTFRVGVDIGIAESATGGIGKRIIRSDDIEVIAKGLRQNSVLGLLPKNISVSKKALDSLRENEKPIFIPLAEVTSYATCSSASF